MLTNYVYLIHTYIPNLALNNQQCLVGHKTKTNDKIFHLYLVSYQYSLSYVYFNFKQNFF